MANNDFLIPARLPAAPKQYDEINEKKFRRILELMLRKVQPPGEGDDEDDAVAGGLPQRRNVRTTISFGPGLEHTEGEIDLTQDLPEAAGLFALQSEANYDGVWVRLYASEADRAADIALRPSYLEVDDPVTTPMILDCVFEEPDNMVIRHFDGEVAGVQIFNWDDPALPKLYYAADLPTGASGLTPDYSQTFSGTGAEPPPYVLDPFSASEPFEYGGTGTYPETAGGRYWWYKNYGGLWVAQGQSGEVARLTVGAIDHTSIVSRARAYMGALDSGGWGVSIRYFVSDDVSDWNNLNLIIGLDRTGNCAVRPYIAWIDAAGATTMLDWGADFSIGDGVGYGARTPVWFVAEIETVGPDVIARIYTTLEEDLSGLTLGAEAVVPAEVQVAGHDRIGVHSFRGTVAEANLAYGGMVITDLSLGIGDVNPLNVIYDLGIMPVEAPGGTLVEAP